MPILAGAAVGVLRSAPAVARASALDDSEPRGYATACAVLVVPPEVGVHPDITRPVYAAELLSLVVRPPLRMRSGPATCRP